MPARADGMLECCDPSSPESLRVSELVHQVLSRRVETKSGERTDDGALIAHLTLHYIVQQVVVLACLGIVDLIVRAHHPGHPAMDSIIPLEKIKFVQMSIIAIRRVRLRNIHRDQRQDLQRSVPGLGHMRR